jgi:hypothetical protein
MLHGQKEVLFVCIIIFPLCPDALSLHGSVMIINQSIKNTDQRWDQTPTKESAGNTCAQSA